MATIRLVNMIDMVGFVDPASGKTSEVGCQNAIVIVAQDSDGRAFVLDEYAERSHSDILNTAIFRMNRAWNCKRFGVEASAQQNLYYQALVREAAARRERIILVPVEQPTNQTKEWRITTTVQEWMHNGFLFVDPACKNVRRQLEVYPNSPQVDVVDALASALRMLRNPFVQHRRSEYDDIYNDEARWRQEVRRDNRYRLPGGNSRSPMLGR